MKIIDQWGGEHHTHEVEVRGGEVRCTPDKDRRKREKLGKYDDIKRACEVQLEILYANIRKQTEYIMPAE